MSILGITREGFAAVEGEERAEYIVKACNERPATQARIAELEGVLRKCSIAFDDCRVGYELVSEVKAALAKAQPEEGK